MENKRQESASSSSSPINFDHLFGPKDSSSSSATTGGFGSIFSPPTAVFDFFKTIVTFYEFGSPADLHHAY